MDAFAGREGERGEGRRDYAFSTYLSLSHPLSSSSLTLPERRRGKWSEPSAATSLVWGAYKKKGGEGEETRPKPFLVQKPFELA